MGTMHTPVLLQEAIDALQIQKGEWYIDATFGRGGHTEQILKMGGKVIAFDVDQEAIEYGQKQFAEEMRDKNLILIRENFEKLESETRKITSEEIRGILMDFGVSSPQLDDNTRGFSFQSDAELDMRMDDRLGVKAKDLLMLIDERQLANAFFEYGGEEQSKRVAHAIVETRKRQNIETVSDLVTIIEKVKGKKREHLHPATKIFQALRILVNGELGSIERALPQALNLLETGGRLVTISFHEGEDRIVKNLFREWEQEEKGLVIGKKPIQPTEDEITKNIRSRSAKLRIFEKK